MVSEKDLKSAYIMAIVLFVVGVLCYAAFPAKSPENPVRLMLTNAAGNILFDHKMHTSDEGYGLSCTDCHHDYEEEEGSAPEACGECHEPEPDEDDDTAAMKRKDAFHTQCIGCHEDIGAGPSTGSEACAQCHVM
ncbi:MAG: cytochrome c3 family protein [Desulfobacterales bacterium]|nr:cytochrome c3 family protein [Desulfobacterales bacterium]